MPHFGAGRIEGDRADTLAQACNRNVLVSGRVFQCLSGRMREQLSGWASNSPRPETHVRVANVSEKTSLPSALGGIAFLATASAVVPTGAAKAADAITEEEAHAIGVE